MEGFIKIESATQNGLVGLRVEGRMSKVNLVDKFHVLHCVCQSLHIDSEDLMIFEELEKLDLFGEEVVEVPGAFDKIFGGHHEG